VCRRLHHGGQNRQGEQARKDDAPHDDWDEPLHEPRLGQVSESRKQVV
jgi:hypothetical protein